MLGWGFNTTDPPASTVALAAKFTETWGAAGKVTATLLSQPTASKIVKV